MPPPRSAPPICPRCGYDQSGIVATWAEACPLRGTCSECGLDFEWRLILRREILGPAWSIEHGLRPSPRRVVAAMCRSARQERLWREFELAYQLRPRRLILLAVFSLALNHLVLAAILAVAGELVRVSQAWSAIRPLSFGLWAWPYDKFVSVPFAPGQTLEIVPGLIALQTYLPLLIPPLVMLLFIETMSHVGVRRLHLLRGMAYMALALAPVSVGLVGAWMLFQWLGLVPLAGHTALLVLILLIVAGAWPVIETLRWRAFIKHYLRLPHANWIAASIFIILMLCMLLVPTIIFVVFAN